MKPFLIISFLLPLTFCLANAQTTEDSTLNSFVSEKISISGIEKGEIEKTKLISSKGLEFLNKSYTAYKIAAYRLTLVLKGQGLLEFSNNSGELTEDMKEAIKESPAGTKLFFEYIRCLDPEGGNRPVLPTEFVLK